MFKCGCRSVCPDEECAPPLSRRALQQGQGEGERQRGEGEEEVQRAGERGEEEEAQGGERDQEGERRSQAAHQRLVGTHAERTLFKKKKIYVLSRLNQRIGGETSSSLWTVCSV